MLAVGENYYDDDVDLSDENLRRLYDAFRTQSQHLDLTTFMQTTFYGLCFVGSGGQLPPPSADLAAGCYSATLAFDKMHPVELRRQAFLLAKDCRVAW